MSTERELGPGTYGTPGPDGAAEVPPNVYHPQTAAVPSYEEYPDPAAAHGWQNAYDETRELPAVPSADGSGEAFGGASGRAGRRRRRRRGGRRRVAVVAGVLGVVCAGAVVAVLLSPGPSAAPRSDGRQRTSGGTPGAASARPAVTSPAATTGSVPAAATPAASPAAPTSTASTGTPAAPTAGSPSATEPSAPATTAATATASASSRPDGRGRGRGHGGTRQPK